MTCTPVLVRDTCALHRRLCQCCCCLGFDLQCHFANQVQQTTETLAAFEIPCLVFAGNLLRVAADIRLPESRAMEVDTVHQGPSAGVHRLLGQAYN